MTKEEQHDIEEKIIKRYSRQYKLRKTAVVLSSLAVVIYSLFVLAYNAKTGLTSPVINKYTITELIGFLLISSFWVLCQSKYESYIKIKESVFIRHVLLDKDARMNSKHTVTLINNAEIVKVLSKHTVRAATDTTINGLFTVEHNRKKVRARINYAVFETNFGRISIEIK